MITGMNHITLAVKDIEKSFGFYQDIVGLKPLVKWHRGAYFLVSHSSGAEAQGFWFCLNVDENRVPSPCYTHYAFSVSPTDFDAMSRRIQDAGATIFKDNTSPGESLYFLDPDGHNLEIHVGTWQARLQSKRENLGSWQDVQWFV